MATLKNPSIYDDRSTIGSADELDEYGVWVKIEPEELSDAEADTFPDFDADFSPGIPLDETVEDDTAFEEFAYTEGGEDAGFDDVEALRQDIQSFPPVEPADGALDEPVMDRPVVAPEAAPLAEPAPALASEAAPAAGQMDLSTQLLMKIADELSSIKDELSTLKGEFSAIRSVKPSGGDAEDTGFFDEEEDDKIALTGDELDNIIHTADFTEETGFDAAASLSDDFAPAQLEAPAQPELPAPPPSAAGAEIIYDGLGRPLRTAAPEGNDDSSPAAASDPAETASDSAGAEIIYDGLGRPLNRKISEDDDIEVSFGLKDSDDLEALRENGVEPMTPAPDDTSYLEEDPLAEETLDLSDAVIEEPDLSEGIKDTPLEEPSLDSLSLIDLEDLEGDSEIPAAENEMVEEKPYFEDIAFEDLPDHKASLDSESRADTVNLDEEEAIDLSIFEDDFLVENADVLDEPDGPAEAGVAGDLSFEVLDENAELPVQGNVQDNVITEDSFESIFLDDDGGIDEVTLDEDLEQSLPDGMKIELDLPPPESDELIQDTETEDDKNFDLPGSADTADAGDPALVSTEEVLPAMRMGLRDVLIYMDKLLESLPEEKIHEFAQSEYYNTYKKLFEELGIQ
jgi:hypothetical protein